MSRSIKKALSQRVGFDLARGREGRTWSCRPETTPQHLVQQLRGSLAAFASDCEGSPNQRGRCLVLLPQPFDCGQLRVTQCRRLRSPGS